MFNGRTFRVFDAQGYVGELISRPKLMDSAGQKSIRLEDGREIEVKTEDLKARPDGSFLLREGVEARSGATAPLAEAASVAPPAAMVTQAENENSAADFFEQDYEIARVAVGRVLNEPAVQRVEGDVLILPVVEEVLICEKKTILKEEVRITPRRRAVGEVRQVPAESLREKGRKRED